MYTIGRDNIDGYNFKFEENLKNWRGFFIPSLQQIQKECHSKLEAKQDGLQYVETLILKLLGAIISTNGSVGASVVGSSVIPLHNIQDVEERIRRLIPEPIKIIEKIKEKLSSLRQSRKIKANSLFAHGNDRSPLKTPIDKFHQLLQKDVLCYKTDIQVSQYILAALEYIAHDILQLAGHYVSNMIHTEITSQDIRVAMCADKFLMEIFYKDEDEVDGPPLSANCYYHQSFFDSDFNDGEYGNIGNKTITYSEAVQEFIQEERQFIRELSLIIKVFRDPLIGILPEEDLQKIFINIDDIYEFSIKFLGLLEDAVEVADEDDFPTIGSCFIEIAEDEEMDVFHKYAQNAMNFSFRDHLYYVLSQHSQSSQIKELFSTLYSPTMIATLHYVLPRLLLLPIYHCFSYFKAIEKLKELTTLEFDRENFKQADSTLQSLRNVLEKQKKLNKFGDGYFLRLYGRTHRSTALAKMKEIQNSIDDWKGKDIWQSCNEFIREGVLYKISNSGKSSIGHHLSSNRLVPTERRAFLFDSLLVLCKHSNSKSIVPVLGGSNSQLEWRCKERYFIRNIQINEPGDGLLHSSIYSSIFSNHTNNNNNQQQQQLQQQNNSDSISMLDQSFSSSSMMTTTVPPSSSSSFMMTNSTNNLNTTTSLSTTTTSQLMNENNNTNTNNNNNNNGINAFEISETNHNQSITLVAKTSEEKDSWISQLLLLNMRPMLERALDAKLSEEAKKHPLLLPHPSVYRFAIEDMDTNIIFEENKSNSNVPLIKGATLLKLVERLTYHKYGDPVLVRIFLTTYRSFCTPIELLKLLIERFEIPEPDFRSCMQAMHYFNDELLSSPTSMVPPIQESSLLSSSNNNNDQQQQQDGDNVTDSNNNNNQNGNGGPISPTSPTLSINSQYLPATPSDSQIFFDEQDEQCQQNYREMLKRFRKEYAQPVQFRVLNVLRHWIYKHYYDFERDNQLLEMLNDFLDEKLAKSHSKVAKWCHHIRNVIDRSKKLQKTSTEQLQQQQLDNISLCSMNPNNNGQIEKIEKIEQYVLSQFNNDEFDLLAFSAETVANHLTLFEFELYRAVKPHELIGTDDQSLVWTKKDKQKTSPNLLKMMRHYSIMSYYFEKCIVETKNFEERIAMVTRIVEIMIILMKNNNFNGAFEIVSALGSAPVHRLEHTRASLEKNSKLKKAIEETEELTKDHFKKYKEKLFSINPPCVPFFGNFLTNIVHLEEGNPEYLQPPNIENISIHESQSQPQQAVAPVGGGASSIIQLDDGGISSKLINFQKKRRVAETISMIQQYQNEPYSHLKMDNQIIKNFFDNLDTIVLTEQEDKILNDNLFKKSLEIEPRGCKQPTKFARTRNLKQISKSKNIRLPSISGISSHQSQSSISFNNHNHHHHHQNSGSSLIGSGGVGNPIDSDSISLQQQQSPSTPLTPPASYCHDAIFAPVMIGGGGNNATTSGTPHISPTTPNLHACFFPNNTPATPPQTSHGFHHSSLHNHNHVPISSPLSPPSSSTATEFPSISTTPTFLNHDEQQQPPPLPPRGATTEASTANGADDGSVAPPPPLPPRTYKRAQQPPPPKMSYRDKGPPPLPRMSISSNSSIINNSQHYHQRVNSDIVLSSSSSSPTAVTSPNNGGVGGITGASNTTNGPAIVRRNSTMDNCTTLPPRRFSQGGVTSSSVGPTVAPPPPPPPLPPTPLTASPKANTLFNLISGQQPQPSSPLLLSSSVHQSQNHPPPPPLPPAMNSNNNSVLMRPPPISPSPLSSSSNNNNNNNNNNNTVPELPPKTYRLSNACR